MDITKTVIPVGKVLGGSILLVAVVIYIVTMHGATADNAKHLGDLHVSVGTIEEEVSDVLQRMIALEMSLSFCAGPCGPHNEPTRGPTLTPIPTDTSPIIGTTNLRGDQ